MKIEHTLKSALIGGTSHSGKSTLAKNLSSKLGLDYLSTDSLARHPGRPWKERLALIPDHVRKHYSLLSADELLSDVLIHYKKVWPMIYTILESNEINGKMMVLEGSALWPTTVNEYHLHGVWLTASHDFLQHRIYSSSDYQHKTMDEQRLIDKFLERTLRYNELMMKEIEKCKLPYLNVENFSTLDELTNQCEEMLPLGKRIKN